MGIRTFERLVSPSLLVVFCCMDAVTAPIIDPVTMRQVARHMDRRDVPDQVMSKGVLRL